MARSASAAHRREVYRRRVARRRAHTRAMRCAVVMRSHALADVASPRVGLRRQRLGRRARAQRRRWRRLCQKIATARRRRRRVEKTHKDGRLGLKIKDVRLDAIRGRMRDF